MPENKQLTINANPTKDFFISMLIKDIKLIDAIIDLVDNSVDGAIRIKGGSDDYSDLTVRLNISEDKFTISDNCGGIPINIAKNYAFRFGRSSDMEDLPHSIGRFGVGMKRAIFKLGNEFKVESWTSDSHFIVQESVIEWNKKEKWEFHFSLLETNLSDVSRENQGTTLTITVLHENIKEDFRNEFVINKLGDLLKSKHHFNIEKGLSITLNGIPITIKPINLFSSDDLKPVNITEKFCDDAGNEIGTAVIYAGVSEPSNQDSGWNIYCNGRLILGPDRDIITGWGEGRGRTIPRFHGQFNRFRGFVFFDADDPSILPWNTTKTGVDEGVPWFRSVRLKMITLMRPVIDFLNQLDREKDKPIDDDYKPLDTALRSSNPVKLDTLPDQTKFVSPKPSPPPPLILIGRIVYNKPKKLIDKMKKVMKVTKQAEVGSKSFDYFFARECEE